jgi:uncharacterized membrane protein YsdA (DUF1294 family)
MKPRKTRHVSSSSSHHKAMNKTTAKILSYGLSTLKVIVSIAAFLCMIQLLSSVKSIVMIPIPVLIRRMMVYAYIIVNAFTVIAFGYDKTIAITSQSQKRISEVSLLQYCCMGGLCGAIIAMELFHHKTKKSKVVHIVYYIALTQIVLIWYAFYADRLPLIKLVKLK